MKDIAIAYTKVDNHNGSYNLEPTGIIEGKFYKRYGVFEDEDGEEYRHVGEFNPRYDTFFTCATNFNEWKSLPENKDLDEVQLRIEFFNKHAFAEKNDVKQKISYSAEICSNSNTIELKRKIPVCEISMNPELDLADFQRYLKRHVIGQDDAIVALTNALKDNEILETAKNIILTGPKGSGKTTMLKYACKYLGIPFYSTSAVTYTNGVIAAKPENTLFTELVAAFNGDDAVDQNGILVITGVDKALLLNKGDQYHASSVVDSLYNFVKGTRLGNGDVEYNTSNVIVVIEGNFADVVFDYERGPAGYVHEHTEPEDTNITEDDLCMCGIPDEFMEYFTVINLKDLSVKDIETMLTKLLTRTQRVYRDSNGANVKYEGEYLTKLAQKIHATGNGAKFIQDALNDSLLYVKDAASKGKVKTFKLTGNTVDNNKNYDTKS